MPDAFDISTNPHAASWARFNTDPRKIHTASPVMPLHELGYTTPICAASTYSETSAIRHGWLPKGWRYRLSMELLPNGTPAYTDSSGSGTYVYSLGGISVDIDDVLTGPGPATDYSARDGGAHIDTDFLIPPPPTGWGTFDGRPVGFAPILQGRLVVDRFRFHDRDDAGNLRYRAECRFSFGGILVYGDTDPEEDPVPVDFYIFNPFNPDHPEEGGIYSLVTVGVGCDVDGITPIEGPAASIILSETSDKATTYSDGYGHVSAGALFNFTGFQLQLYWADRHPFPPT